MPVKVWLLSWCSKPLRLSKRSNQGILLPSLCLGFHMLFSLVLSLLGWWGWGHCHSHSFQSGDYSFRMLHTSGWRGWKTGSPREATPTPKGLAAKRIANNSTFFWASFSLLVFAHWNYFKQTRYTRTWLHGNEENNMGSTLPPARTEGTDSPTKGMGNEVHKNDRFVSKSLPRWYKKELRSSVNDSDLNEREKIKSTRVHWCQKSRGWESLSISLARVRDAFDLILLSKSRAGSPPYSVGSLTALLRRRSTYNRFKVRSD